MTQPIQSPHLSELIETRLSRRGVLGGLLGSAAGIAFASSLMGAGSRSANADPKTVGFKELGRVYDDHDHLAEDHARQVLLRWGDPVVKGAKAFDPAALEAEAQAGQFGYNNDFIGFVSLPRGSNASDHGVLGINHEYISPNAMFPGMTEDDAHEKMTEAQIRYAMSAVGHTIVEVKRGGEGWAVVADSPLNRRITLATEMRMSGPAAGHSLLRTKADPSGTRVLGTIYNCSGGVTPWGTILTCEEGASDTFGGDASKAQNADLLDRYGYDGSDFYGFAQIEERFRLDVEPNEPNRFDWVVEIDPHDPASAPVKRTALGRFSHEGAHCVLNHDGRIVVYMGDDDRFEFVYRFVSDGTFDPGNLEGARDLLDKGELSVGRFDADGGLAWLPLVHGQGGLTAANGFADQGEVLIKARLAGSLLGATPMDRPEGFVASPTTGRVYVALTNNTKRKPDALNAANTRPENNWGQILELTPPGEAGKIDHTAAKYTWDTFILAGDPADAATGARYGAGTSANGWFSNPDNLAFDPAGNLWVASDGAPSSAKVADGLYAVATDGAARAVPRLLYAAPMGAEVTGPCFTPDGTTLFLSVQHPGEDSETFEALTTRWPDFDDKTPPRPSVIAITRKAGGPVGA